MNMLLKTGAVLSVAALTVVATALQVDAATQRRHAARATQPPTIAQNANEPTTYGLGSTLVNPGGTLVPQKPAANDPTAIRAFPGASTNFDIPDSQRYNWYRN